MKTKIYLSFVFLFTFSFLFSQEKTPSQPEISGKMTMTIIPSFAEQIKTGRFIAKSLEKDKIQGKPKRMGINRVVPGKGFPKGIDPLINQQINTLKTQGKAPSLIFDAATASYIPSDPTGAAGPNHYIGGWNSGFRIFDKLGVPLIPEASLSTLFPGNTDGDPIVLYDAAADRFIITEFFGFNNGNPAPPYGFNIAVSQGSDPVNSGWYVYSFTTSQLPDYPKYSIWSDGYYITTNIGATNKVYVLERSKMLTGSTAQYLGFPLTGLVTGGFYSPQVFNVCNANMPATGNATVVYFQDDAWTGVSTDHLKLWTVNVDWNNTANSNISAPIQIATSPFNSVFDGGSFANLSQPSGPDIDALQATIMNQAQFRKFPNHNSAIFNFVVDTNTGGGELAGIRWYELRQTADGQAWSLYQEGTYVSPSGKHAFNGSMAMDSQGNIGMGYSTVSSSSNIAINYTGRYANDPVGVMSVAETLIAQSTYFNPYSRYADYSHLTVDPSDDDTFWYITEYFHSARKDVVGVFNLASVYNNDVGIVQIATPNTGGPLGMETVGVMIKNYGNNPQTNFNVAYQVDGGATVTENCTLTIPSGQTAPFVFSTPTDMSIPGQTYSLMCTTQLTTDQDTSNDAMTKNVTHLFMDDVGISAVAAPTSGNTLCMENITVNVENFGVNPQSGFEIFYILDGQPLVSEIFPYNIPQGASAFYTFAAPGDFCSFGDHHLHVSTNLPTDMNHLNDTLDATITNIPCTTNSNNNNQIIPDNMIIVSTINIPFSEVITDVDVKINLQHAYDADLDVYLIAPDGLMVELTTDNGGSGQNYTNTYFDDSASSSITSGTAPFTGDFKPEGNLSDFNGSNSSGIWTLEITDDTGNGFSGNLLNWDLNICFDPSVDVYENTLDSSNMIISTLENNQFNISLVNHSNDEDISIEVYTIYGKKIVTNRMIHKEGTYNYDLDMSYASSGVYLIKLSNHENFGVVKRIIVK